MVALIIVFVVGFIFGYILGNRDYKKETYFGDH
jgi:hypothetical protein